MFHFEIKDPNEGLGTVLESLLKNGIHQDSRNGPVLRFPKPVCLEYVTPQNRVMTSPIRDANPFFHLFETMWMFAGMNELAPLLLFNEQIAQYSDDGKILRGTAYGHRWRELWGDQLARAVDMLRTNPQNRQVVMSMWDPREIFTTNSKDFACNLQVLFSTRPDVDGVILDMTVTNRSNDLIYGAMGSNLFHFSMLLEYIALHSGLRVGTYYQIANNLHLYTENETAKRCLEQRADLKKSASVVDESLTRVGLTLDRKTIRKYVENHEVDISDRYLTEVVRPLVEAYRLFKIKSRFGIKTELVNRIHVAIEMCCNSYSHPLASACSDWLERRIPGRKPNV